MKHIAYIGLGANLDNPKQQIETAIIAISKLNSIQLLARSSCYQSQAMIAAKQKKQADYINAVIKIETTVTPEKLLKICQQIEDQQGRVRIEHWGARTLDLDIILYDDLIYTSDTLSIPHPRAHLRAFVLQPLVEISPQIQIPKQVAMFILLQQTNDQIIRRCHNNK